MSQDIGCLGICIVDPDTGVCVGCGRGPEEISGVPMPDLVPCPTGSPCGRPTGTPCGRKNPDESPLSASQYPLPPQVAGQIGGGD